MIRKHMTFECKEVETRRRRRDLRYGGNESEEEEEEGSGGSGGARELGVLAVRGRRSRIAGAEKPPAVGD